MTSGSGTGSEESLIPLGYDSTTLRRRADPPEQLGELHEMGYVRGLVVEPRRELDERLAVLHRNRLCLEGVEKHQIHRMRDPNQWGRAIGRTSNGRAGKPAELLIGNVAY